ncbi:hypothetical protein Tco_0889525, partial [Tanacetum coccineum]
VKGRKGHDSPKKGWVPMSERFLNPTPITQYNPITNKVVKESGKEKPDVVKEKPDFVMLQRQELELKEHVVGLLDLNSYWTETEVKEAKGFIGYVENSEKDDLFKRAKEKLASICSERVRLEDLLRKANSDYHGGEGSSLTSRKMCMGIMMDVGGGGRNAYDVEGDGNGNEDDAGNGDDEDGGCKSIEKQVDATTKEVDATTKENVVEESDEITCTPESFSQWIDANSDFVLEHIDCVVDEYLYGDALDAVAEDMRRNNEGTVTLERLVTRHSKASTSVKGRRGRDSPKKGRVLMSERFLNPTRITQYNPVTNEVVKECGKEKPNVVVVNEKLDVVNENPDVVKEKPDFVKENPASVKEKPTVVKEALRYSRKVDKEAVVKNKLSLGKSNVPIKLHKDKVDKEVIADKASVQDDPGNSSSVVMSKDDRKGVNDKVLDVVAKDKPKGSASSVVVNKDKRKESFEKEALFQKDKALNVVSKDNMGQTAKTWDCGLVAESKQQCDMLRQLRFKFATKILLHEINVHAQKMIRYAEEFDKIADGLKGKICLDVVKRIREDTVISDIDWCGYVYDCLRESKLPKEPSLLFLVVRTRPAVKNWTSYLMRQRQELELKKRVVGLLDLNSDWTETEVKEAEGFIGSVENFEKRAEEKLASICSERVRLEDLLRKANSDYHGDGKFVELQEKYVQVFKDPISFDVGMNSVDGDDGDDDDGDGNRDDDARGDSDVNQDDDNADSRNDDDVGGDGNGNEDDAGNGDDEDGGCKSIEKQVDATTKEVDATTKEVDATTK